MNVYEFKCTVWVRGESAEAARKELHDEVDYLFGLDNNLVALESELADGWPQHEKGDTE